MGALVSGSIAGGFVSLSIAVFLGYTPMQWQWWLAMATYSSAVQHIASEARRV